MNPSERKIGSTDAKKIIFGALDYLQRIREHENMPRVWIVPYKLYERFHQIVGNENLEDSNMFPTLSEFQTFVYNFSVELLDDPDGPDICAVRHCQLQTDGGYSYQEKILGYVVPRDGDEKTINYKIHADNYNDSEETKHNILNSKRHVKQKRILKTLPANIKNHLPMPIVI